MSLSLRKWRRKMLDEIEDYHRARVDVFRGGVLRRVAADAAPFPIPF
jgi:hypothetical protein